jgi:morphogenetic protein associated with SpoVID
MPVGNVAPQPGGGWSRSAGGETATVVAGETANQLASRLGVPVQDLLQANPQITDPNRLPGGLQVHVPPRSDGPPPPKGPRQDSARGGAVWQAGPGPGESQLAASAAKARLYSSTKTSASTASAQAAAPAPAASPYISSDPRFAAFNAAFDAGNGGEAMDAAGKLLAQLQSE